MSAEEAAERVATALLDYAILAGDAAYTAFRWFSSRPSLADLLSARAYSRLECEASPKVPEGHGTRVVQTHFGCPSDVGTSVAE